MQVASRNPTYKIEKLGMEKVPPLHAAIWAGDVAGASALLSAAGDSVADLLEARDVHGNSALHLAVRTSQPAQRELVQLLLSHDARAASKNDAGWSCIHDAALCDDEFLLALLYLQSERQVWQTVQTHQPRFVEALTRLPDFAAEIFVEARSWVPIVSQVLPSDTIRLWKRGAQLRCDMSLKGLDGVKWKKGLMSNVFDGATGRVAIIDHDNRTFYDVTQAARESTLENIDLAIQLMLTTSMSTSTMTTDRLEFVKHDKVKASKEPKAAATSRRARRQCPWGGIKYRMQNFALAAQFRPAVSSRRKLRMQSADDPLNEIQGFVNHLTTHAGKSKDRRNGKNSGNSESSWRESSEASSSISDAAAAGDDNGLQVLRLPKGKSVEMHLDVCAGDLLEWEFSSKSKDFHFVATYFHEDQQMPVCQTQGVKNAAIVGEFRTEHNGSFVLKWQNTQTNFSLDRHGIKVKYKVRHTRPMAAPPGAEAVAAGASVDTSMDLSSSPDNEETDSDGVSSLTDAQKCEAFLRPGHIPNPLTTTVAFNEYFSADERETDSGNEPDSKSSRAKTLFKRRTPAQPTRNDGTPNTQESQFKNTYRSLTVLPVERKVHKEFEAKVVMSEEFPFQLRDFLPVIEFVADSGEHVKNLKEFFHMVRTHESYRSAGQLSDS